MPQKRTQEQEHACHETIRDLLGHGIKHSIVVSHVQQQHGISRATAYRDLEAVAQEMDASHHDFAEPVDFADRDALLRMANQLAVQAYVQGDINGFSRITREYERLSRMGGTDRQGESAIHAKYSLPR